MDSEPIAHESFGYIVAHRTSGYAPLFDSAIKHQHYVSVEIGSAVQYVQNGESRVHPVKQLVRVAMSESQFAQFITSMNVSSGAPCTIERFGGKRMAEPPPDRNTRQTFEDEIKGKAQEIANRCQDAITQAHALADAGKANKSQLRLLASALETMQSRLVDDMPFMMEMFAEAMEKHIDRAKMDINAHAVMAGFRLSASDLQAVEDGTNT